MLNELKLKPMRHEFTKFMWPLELILIKYSLITFGGKLDVTILWLYLWLLSISQWPVRGIHYDHLSTSVRGIPCKLWDVLCDLRSPGGTKYLSLGRFHDGARINTRLDCSKLLLWGPALRKCLVVYKSFHIIFLQGEKFHDLPSWIFSRREVKIELS